MVNRLLVNCTVAQSSLESSDVGQHSVWYFAVFRFAIPHSFLVNQSIVLLRKIRDPCKDSVGHHFSLGIS